MSKTTVKIGIVIGLLATIFTLGGCLGHDSFANAGSSSEPELPPYGLVSPQQGAEVVQTLEDDPAFVLLDIRTAPEVEAGHIPGAVMLDYYSETFRDDVSRMDRSFTYLIYCRTGNRTGNAYHTMQELGFDRVYDLDGGITQWAAAGLPTCEGLPDEEGPCTGEYPAD